MLELKLFNEKYNGEKLLIFVQYRATQEYLTNELARNHVRAEAFRGNPDKRNDLLRWFKKVGEVLICCDSTGAEGLNLQDTCHIVINYDLPWNPMTIEQRIGRVHRIGQKKEVQVINLVIQDTIEDYILSILFERINLFRVAIGDMDLILGISKLDGSETNMERIIAETIASQNSKEDIKAGLQKKAAQHFGKKPEELQEMINSFHEEVFSDLHLYAFNAKYGDER